MTFERFEPFEPFELFEPFKPSVLRTQASLLGLPFAAWGRIAYKIAFSR